MTLAEDQLHGVPCIVGLGLVVTGHNDYKGEAWGGGGNQSKQEIPISRVAVA